MDSIHDHKIALPDSVVGQYHYTCTSVVHITLTIRRVVDFDNVVSGIVHESQVFLSGLLARLKEHVGGIVEVRSVLKCPIIQALII